jgi:hypothetical protein
MTKKPPKEENGSTETVSNQSENRAQFVIDFNPSPSGGWQEVAAAMHTAPGRGRGDSE